MTQVRLQEPVLLMEQVLSLVLLPLVLLPLVLLMPVVLQAPLVMQVSLLALLVPLPPPLSPPKGARSPRMVRLFVAGYFRFVICVWWVGSGVLHPRADGGCRRLAVRPRSRRRRLRREPPRLGEPEKQKHLKIEITTKTNNKHNDHEWTSLADGRVVEHAAREAHRRGADGLTMNNEIKTYNYFLKKTTKEATKRGAPRLAAPPVALRRHRPLLLRPLRHHLALTRVNATDKKRKEQP